jgi:hypothetical protein
MGDNERLLEDVEAWSYDLVAIRADLRFDRQQLARRKRQVARDARLAARTAREREQELDLLVHADPEVIRLEDKILVGQREDERLEARINARLRMVQQEQWLVRQQMSDAVNALAVSVAQSPLAHLSFSLASILGERSIYQGDSQYHLERELG